MQGAFLVGGGKLHHPRDKNPGNVVAQHNCLSSPKSLFIPSLFLVNRENAVLS